MGRAGFPHHRLARYRLARGELHLRASAHDSGSANGRAAGHRHHPSPVRVPVDRSAARFVVGSSSAPEPPRSAAPLSESGPGYAERSAAIVQPSRLPEPGQLDEELGPDAPLGESGHGQALIGRFRPRLPFRQVFHQRTEEQDSVEPAASMRILAVHPPQPVWPDTSLHPGGSHWLGQRPRQVRQYQLPLLRSQLSSWLLVSFYVLSIFLGLGFRGRASLACDGQLHPASGCGLLPSLQEALARQQSRSWL